MTREELLEKKQIGDINTAAKMLKITPRNALKLWQRPQANRYPELANALEAIILARESLIENHFGNDSK